MSTRARLEEIAYELGDFLDEELGVADIPEIEGGGVDLCAVIVEMYGMIREKDLDPQPVSHYLADEHLGAIAEDVVGVAEP